jgi:hypothetical protein
MDYTDVDDELIQKGNQDIKNVHKKEKKGEFLLGKR